MASRDLCSSNPAALAFLYLFKDFRFHDHKPLPTIDSRENTVIISSGKVVSLVLINYDFCRGLRADR